MPNAKSLVAEHVLLNSSYWSKSSGAQVPFPNYMINLWFNVLFADTIYAYCVSYTKMLAVLCLEQYERNYKQGICPGFVFG